MPLETIRRIPPDRMQYGVDGDHDGQLDIYDPADAVFTAAALLCAHDAAAGTPGGWAQAVFAFNHDKGGSTCPSGLVSIHGVRSPHAGHAGILRERIDGFAGL